MEDDDKQAAKFGLSLNEQYIHYKVWQDCVHWKNGKLTLLGWLKAIQLSWACLFKLDINAFN